MVRYYDQVYLSGWYDFADYYNMDGNNTVIF